MTDTERVVAVAGLGAAAMAGYFAVVVFIHRIAFAPELVGSAVYRAGEWAGRIGGMAWAAVLACVAGWLLGACLRRALGIPVARRRLPPALQVVRVVAAGGILLRMCTWEMLGGHGARFAGIDMSPESALIHGLILCALVGFELPGLVARGVRCLRARVPSLRARRASLDALPERGRVRVAGVVGAEGLAGGVAYCRGWDAGAERVEIEGRPFQLEAGGHRVWVDLDPGRAVVDAPVSPESGDGARMELRAGSRVEVVGELVEAMDGAYRGGVRRVHAGAGVLYVLGGAGALNRRLLVAGLVELAAAAVMACAPLMLLVYWLMARWSL